MLYIHTKKEANTIINIESLFLLRYTDIKNKETDPPAVLCNALCSSLRRSAVAGCIRVCESFSVNEIS